MKKFLDITGLTYFYNWLKKLVEKDDISGTNENPASVKLLNKCTQVLRGLITELDGKVVKVTEQTLTDEQKQQARNNIGADGNLKKSANGGFYIETDMGSPYVANGSVSFCGTNDDISGTGCFSVGTEGASTSIDDNSNGCVNLGASNIARAMQSVSIGMGNVIDSGNNSYLEGCAAIGVGNNVSHSRQIVVGVFGKSEKNSVFVVGRDIGDGSTDGKNAFVVKTNGDVNIENKAFAGTAEAPAEATDPHGLITKSQLDKSIGDIKSILESI